MAIISAIDTVILLGAALLLVGILSSLVATRFGTPLLLIFLGIGMLAGEDGPGGIAFNDYRATYLIGSVALAIILFDGGMRAQLATFRAGLRPGLVLATLGVLLTAAITALFARVAFWLSWPEALLIGSIVASTDAAAVFFLVRTHGLELNQRVGVALEVESGTNDPVAVFATIMLLEGIKAGWQISPAHVLLALGEQAAIGTLAGVAGGFAISAAVNRLALPSGLQPLFVVTGAVFIFALTQTAHGSGFLAVYLAGLIVGNRPLRAHSNIVDFHDAATWFCQIVMFLVLGLVASPSHLLSHLGASLVVAFGLTFVARPLAVWICLKLFGFSREEILFVAWVGLRGAVGIFLASIPVLTGLPNAELDFDVAFVIVLVSLLVQGWTIAPAARWLGVALPPRPTAKRVELDLPGQLEYEIVGYAVPPDSMILHHVAPPSWARLLLLVRDDQVLSPQEAGELRPDDHAYFLAPPWRIHLLDRLFALPADVEADQSFFGEFTFRGDVTLGTLAELYGLSVPPDKRGTTVTDYFAEAINEHPVVGDRVPLGASALIVREMDRDRVISAGLQLESAPARRLLPAPLRRILRLDHGGADGG